MTSARQIHGQNTQSVGIALPRNLSASRRKVLERVKCRIPDDILEPLKIFTLEILEMENVEELSGEKVDKEENNTDLTSESVGVAKCLVGSVRNV